MACHGHGHGHEDLRELGLLDDKLQQKCNENLVENDVLRQGNTSQWQ